MEKEIVYLTDLVGFIKSPVKLKIDDIIAVPDTDGIVRNQYRIAVKKGDNLTLEKYYIRNSIVVKPIW